MKGFIGGAVLAAALLLTPAAAFASGGGPKAEIIKLEDDCDKPSWDATFGPGICQVDAGGVTPAEWQSKMNPQDFGHGAWWINASGGRVGTTKIKVGDILRVQNIGGEAHTFTQDESYGVAGFTGGCIAPLSNPLGISLWNGDCGAAIGNTTVQPGKTVDFKAPEVGRYHYQCIFHPWMRQTVVVERS